MRRIWIALLAVLLVACGSPAQPTVTPTQTGIGFATDPNKVIIELIQGPGFTMPIYARMLEAPQVRVYGNGRVIYRYMSDDGMKTEWQETTLTPAEMQALLMDVVGTQNDLCLSGAIGDPDPMVSDMGSTMIRVNTDQSQCAVDVFAPAIEQRAAMPADAARKYAQFVKATKALGNLISVSRKAYEPELVTMYVEESPGAGDQQVVEWKYSQKPENGQLLKSPDAGAFLRQAAMPAFFTFEGKTYMMVGVPQLP